MLLSSKRKIVQDLRPEISEEIRERRKMKGKKSG